LFYEGLPSVPGEYTTNLRCLVEEFILYYIYASNNLGGVISNILVVPVSSSLNRGYSTKIIIKKNRIEGGKFKKASVDNKRKKDKSFVAAHTARSGVITLLKLHLCVLYLGLNP
jgi:hypothetical protein